ncbi:hypothetical protein ONZ45_g16652 [Pleurotus djamor]|nr:hypothetical protein ONZ45_g16652 [Pleurotus djamor]
MTVAIALLPGVIFLSVKIVAQPRYKNDDIIYLRILIDMQHAHSHYYTLTDLRSVEQTVALYKKYCKGAMPTIGPDAQAQVLVAFDAIPEDVKTYSIMKKACEDIHIVLQATKEKTTNPVNVGRKIHEIMIKSATELLLIVKARQPRANKDPN